MILGVPSAHLAFTHPFQNPVEEEEEEEEAVYLGARIWEQASEGGSGRIVFHAAEERTAVPGESSRFISSAGRQHAFM